MNNIYTRIWLTERTRFPVAMRTALIAIGVVVCAHLAGCASYTAHREGQQMIATGQADRGISRLEEAVRLEPRNAEYRLTLASSRAQVLNQLLQKADTAVKERRWEDAESTLNLALKIDGDQPEAKRRLELMTRERRHAQFVSEAEMLMQKPDASELAAVAERLRAVLSENPNHADALRVKAALDDRYARIPKPEQALSVQFRKPISVEFRDAPFRSVLTFLGQASGLQFVVDSEVKSDLRTTITLKSTTIESALNLLLATHQLRHRVLSDTTVLVYPNTSQKLRDYQAQILKTFFVTNADVKTVSTAIKTLVKTQDLVMDERIGIIMMRDTPEAIRLAEQIVALHDVSEAEVMLEVEILEVKRSRLLELGIQWPGQLSLSPLVARDGALTLSSLRNLRPSSTQVTVGNASVNARQDDQDAAILANPRIRVRNKERAKVTIGDKVPVITTTATNLAVAETVNYIDVGLKLEVEPIVHMNDEVSIKINLEVSNLVREVVSKAGTLSFQIGNRAANTVLRLKAGETQILAGLISDEDRATANKLPGLGELPVAGRLFGSRRDDRQSSEILLSITPRVIRSIKLPDTAQLDFDAGTASNLGSRPLLLQSNAISNTAATDQSP